MAFQYNGPGVTPKDTVRFLVGDTNAHDVLLEDNEIQWVLGLYNQAPMNAAIRCCETIIAKFSRLASEKVGPVAIQFEQKAKAYRILLNDLRNRLMTEDSDYIAGGIHESQSIADSSNHDLVRPDFRKHMMENQLISPWIAGPVNEFPDQWWW